MNGTWQKYMAEAFGTAMFVFIAAGSVLANAQTAALGAIGIALAHGMALAAVIYSTSHISGGHVNPAVTIAAWATGQMKTAMAAGYVVAQLVGSVVAALLLRLVYSNVSPQYYLGDALLAQGVSPGFGIFVEALLTFFLAWTIFSVAMDKRANTQFGGLAIGFVMSAAVLIGGNITMAALNPARSFGPALISSHWEYHYVYWIGPILGALLAGVIYHFGLGKKQSG